MHDAQGRQLRTLTLKSPDDIKAALEEAEQHRPGQNGPDEITVIARKVVVPLILDVRNVLIAVLDTLQTMNSNLVALVQISTQTLQEKQVDVRSKILGGR